MSMYCITSILFIFYRTRTDSGAWLCGCYPESHGVAFRLNCLRVWYSAESCTVLQSSAVMKLMSVTMTDYRPGCQVSIPSWNKEFVTPINFHTVSVIRPCKGKRYAVPGNHSPWALIWSLFQCRTKVNVAWNVISFSI